MVRKISFRRSFLLGEIAVLKAPDGLMRFGLIDETPPSPAGGSEVKLKPETRNPVNLKPEP